MSERIQLQALAFSRHYHRTTGCMISAESLMSDRHLALSAIVHSQKLDDDELKESANELAKQIQISENEISMARRAGVKPPNKKAILEDLKELPISEKDIECVRIWIKEKKPDLLSKFDKYLHNDPGNITFNVINRRMKNWLDDSSYDEYQKIYSK